MIRLLALLALASCAVAASASAQTADPTGLWATPTNGAQVRIARCGQALCGTLVTANTLRANPDLRDVHNPDRTLRTRRMQGLRFLSGFSGGPTEWRGGSVYNPEDGRTYRGAIALTDANTLNLRGCVVAPLCRTQTWTRVH